MFWAATAYWVYKDARRRIEDPWMIAMAVVLGIVPPFLGPIIYMFFRPPEYLEEVRERELEIKAMEERLARRDLHCPVCRAEVEATYLVCPVCTTKLKQACVTCKAPLEALWQVCPYCETPVDTPTAIRVDSWEPRGAAAAGRAAASSDATAAPRSNRGTIGGRMATERTLVLLKPDAVRRGICGELVARFERRGLTLRGARLLKISRQLAERALRRAQGRSRSTATSSRSSPRARRWRSRSRASRRSRSSGR